MTRSFIYGEVSVRCGGRLGHPIGLEHRRILLLTSWTSRVCPILSCWIFLLLALLQATSARAAVVGQVASSGTVVSSAPRTGQPSPPGPSVSPVHASQALPLHLYVGQAFVLNEPGVKRIAVGNGKVVQATALDARQILLLPEAPGQTALVLWGPRGVERHYTIHVAAADIGQLLLEVRSLLGPASGVEVRVVGDRVVLEGRRIGEEASARLAEVIKRYPQVVNLVQRVGNERMIGMDVRMIEIKRDVLRNIGVKWNGTADGPSVGIIADLVRSPELRPGGAAQGAAAMEVRPRIAGVAGAISIASSVTSMLNLLVQNGDAVVLAEPRLSCRSGGTARFVAGGELPIPYSSAVGHTSVTFKEYGIKFDVAPIAGDDGMIAARIATEISSVDFGVVVREVPGLSKRRAESDVNLRENETLVIAGLLNEDVRRSIDRVAAMGDLPVLGPLFRSKLFRDQKTELAVLITPSFLDSADDAGRQRGDELRGRAAGLIERLRMLE